MRKYVAIVLCFCIAFCLAACNKTPEENDFNSANYLWTEVKYMSWNESGNNLQFSIAMPCNEGVVVTNGFGGPQDDGTFVFVGSQKDTDKIGDIDFKDSFSFFKEIICSNINELKSDKFEKIDIVTNESEQINHGGKTFLKTAGKVIFTSKKGSTEKQFVSYVNQLSNDAYIFWIVIDESDNQSLLKTINETALTMSETIKEYAVPGEDGWY